LLARLGLERISQRWVKSLSWDTEGHIAFELHNGQRVSGYVTPTRGGIITHVPNPIFQENP
jgi:hypothetical protein